MWACVSFARASDPSCKLPLPLACPRLNPCLSLPCSYCCALQGQATLDEAEAEEKLQVVADALAELIASVPSDVLERSRRVLEAARPRPSPVPAAAADSGEAKKEQSLQDVELLQELLQIWE